MALRDALKTPTPKRPGFRSKVDIWRDALDADDRDAFDAAVHNPAWRTSDLLRVANAEGLDIGDAGFRSWRDNTLRRAA